MPRDLLLGAPELNSTIYIVALMHAIALGSTKQPSHVNRERGL